MRRSLLSGLLSWALILLAPGCVEPGGAGTPAPITWSDVSAADPGPSDVSRADKGESLSDLSMGLVLMNITAPAGELQTLHERFEEELVVDVEVQLGERTWTGVHLKLHGGFARTVPKKSYRLIFPDDDKLEADLFGEGHTEELRRLVLQASWIDRTFMRNKLSMDLIRDMGGMAPRVGYLILTINGEWLGLYQTIERIDRTFLGRENLNKDGNLYKAENHWANWQAKENPLAGFDVQEGEENPHDDLGELLNALTHTPLTHADFKAEVAPRLDLEDFLIWQQVHTLAMNHDTFTKNYFLYHDLDAAAGHPSARFRIISWDADATWGNDWDGAVLEPSEAAWHGSDSFSPRLFALDAYKSAYINAYLEALSGPLSLAVMKLRVAAIESLISEAAQASLERWQESQSFALELSRLQENLTIRAETMKSVLEAEAASGP